MPSRQALSARAMPLPLLVGTGNIELRDVHMLCECLCALLDAQKLFVTLCTFVIENDHLIALVT